MTAKPDRPIEFRMTIQGGMLEALGINMYTTLGKCLVEFVANAYDGEASEVSIEIPIKDIEAARVVARAKAKAELEAGTRERFGLLLVPLPDELKVTIRDNGVGMTPADVEEKFLPLNRKRRLDADGRETTVKSETGSRYVMGRKGLGKLAGFGAAECVTIRTKRKGETFATSFTMSLGILSTHTNLSGAPIPAVYEDGLPLDEQGTTVTLWRLKCDAVRFGLDNLRDTLAEAFYGITGESFELLLDGAVVQAPTPEYEFEYPEANLRTNDDLARRDFKVPDVGDLFFDYKVSFRNRGDNLAARKRGARIYCNGRLAAGPSLFSLPTGMHNFHSQSYMECVVRADSIDREAIDLIATNRTQLREDNEVVTTLLDEVTDVMRQALTAHSKFRDDTVEAEIEANPTAKEILKIADQAPKRMRDAARKLVNRFAVQYGAGSAEFFEVAPLIVKSMNAGEVLVKLIELGSHVNDVKEVASLLRELAEIERDDALKLFRGRRNAINGLQELTVEGEDTFLSGPHKEKELHQLLKENPWLIRTEFGRYLVSDQDMGKTVTAIAKEMKVDSFAVPKKNGDKDETRPDLVFLMSDGVSPSTVTIVELKAPSIALNYDHLVQLQTYMMQTERWLKAEHSGKLVMVRGILIGAKPAANTTAEKCLLLLRHIEANKENPKEEILGLREMLMRAHQNHSEVIEVLQKIEADEEEKQDLPHKASDSLS